MYLVNEFFKSMVETVSLWNYNSKTLDPMLEFKKVIKKPIFVEEKKPAFSDKT